MAFCGVTFTDEKREFEIFPTGYPVKEFDANTDADTLYKAMEGIGTNEKKIIHIVANRSTEQLKEIAKTFKTIYGDDLMKRLENELSGNLERVVLERFFDRYEYQAYVARRAMNIEEARNVEEALIGVVCDALVVEAFVARYAMKAAGIGAGIDEQALIDVVCSKTPAEMENVKTAYKNLFDRDLIKDIESETSGDLRRILVSIATANRETKEVDVEEAKADADSLYDAGEGKWGTDEKMFNKIFARRSFEQLKLTWLYYRKRYGSSIFDVIEKELSGKLRSAFLTIARYIEDPITYYSEVMYDSMKGLGTDDERLIRAIVSRCEIDLQTVKERYNKLHDKTLEKRIKSETSGDYEKVLLALVKGNK